MMQKQIVNFTPFAEQKPGTSGLRKKTRVFMAPNYLASFVQAIFNAIGGIEGKRLVLGGDGRYFNAQACQIILKMAIAQDAAEVIIGQNGLLSTPAASNLIRKHHTDGGIILSASHNPGGEDEDFGIKFNAANGGPAPESLTAKMYDISKTLNQYAICDCDDIAINKVATVNRGNTKVTVVDPVRDYVQLMQFLFDFDALKALFADGFKFRFDAMHAITGPYAKAIFEKSLGAPEGTVINATPKPDFGGGHPDPNPTWAKALVSECFSTSPPDFAAASDGDGDRNMVLGAYTYINPPDSLAVLTANLHLIKGYKDGLKGVARSMPTSAATDKVAEAMGIPCFETPTGWKFFGNLMDHDKVTLCGEESFGTGSNHVREKDGLWAVLAWLNILAIRQCTAGEMLMAHWEQYGRHYYSRHDYEAIDATAAKQMMAALTEKLSDLKGLTIEELSIESADQFDYTDPTDQSVSRNQGYRVFFKSGERAVMRLSGTGTDGATLRIYYEKYDPDDLSLDPQQALSGLFKAVRSLLQIEQWTGRTAPDVIT